MLAAVDVFELEKQLRELRAALRQARAVADAEHRRAELAEESARRAWRVASGSVRRPAGEPMRLV